jgi:Tfp pilus assembly protein PilF
LAVQIKKNINLARSFYDNGHLDLAKKYLNEIFLEFPEQPEALKLMSFVMLLEGDINNAINLLIKYLNKNPYDDEAHMNLATSYFNTNKVSEAISCINKSIEINPNNAQAYFNRGTFNASEKNFNLALDDFNSAISINPMYAEVYNNRGYIYKEFNDLEKAIEDFDYAIKINDSYCDPKLNKSIIYLYKKFFVQGWDLYENRLKSSKNLNPFILNKPIKTQDVDANKRILILGEQGIGDNILYSSMLEECSRKNNVDILLDIKLVDLFKRSFPNLTFIARDSLIDPTIYDYELPIGSLGLFYRNSINQFKSQPIGYLRADKYRSEKIKSYIKNNLKSDQKKICGISWRSKNNTHGDSKNIELESLVPLFKLEQFFFINLQYGNVSNELREFSLKYGVVVHEIPNIDIYNDIDGLVALVDACDLVVTTSNVTAHIAGSINKETCLIAPKVLGSIWYWHEFDENSIWYPSIKIFRQSKFYELTSSVNAIVKFLESKNL